MGFWSSLLKTGGKAAGATGKAVGGAVLHPSQTLRGAGSALKTATVGAGRICRLGETDHRQERGAHRERCRHRRRHHQRHQRHGESGYRNGKQTYRQSRTDF